ncbi:MAG: sensor domain-containing diguanylate cyclase, partial [Deinococcales bacterium]
MKASWWVWVALALACGWLAAALLASGSGVVSLPPLVVLAVLAYALGGARWAAVATLIGWLGLVAVAGFGPLTVYLGIGMALLVAVLARTIGASEIERRRAVKQLELVGVLLSGLRGVAESEGAWDAASTLPGSVGGGRASGLLLWRTASGEPELLAGNAEFDDADVMADAARRVTEAKREVAERVGTAGGRRYLLAVPVLERGDVVVVLTTLRRRPVPDQELQIVREYGVTLGHVLTRLHEAWSGRVILDLVRQGMGLGGSAPMGKTLLDIVLAETGLSAGAVLRYRAGRFVADTLTGSVPAVLRDRLLRGLAYGEGAVWQVRRDGEPLFIDDYANHPLLSSELAASGVRSVALVPMGTGPGADAVLTLFHDRPRTWPDRERVLLASLASVLYVSVTQRDAEVRLAELVRLQSELLARPVSEMYQRALEAAVRMVPGSEAASLLVRDVDGRFRYAAAVGYDLEKLQDLRLSIDGLRTWYGAEQPGWAAGEPRVLVSTEEHTIGDVSALTTPRQRMQSAGRIDDIAANLSLPILYRGEVLALVNLDALHDQAAFGEAAVRAAADVAPVIGYLLHEADARARLDLVARTDELTGLGNRRAFNEQAVREVARAVRHTQDLAILVMDLSRFKRLNDRFGHAVGDEALQAVADAVRRSVRTGDSIFRWGGDEFAALLPHADAVAAA